MADRWARAGAFARTVATGAAIAAIGIYVAVALGRIDHPFELEWMEGGSLGHVERLRSGLPLYTAPSLDFTAFIYTPLYFHAARLASATFDGGFVPLRGLSFAASLASFALIGLWVARETRDRRAGLLAAGLMAATFEISGAWFDLARVDSLFLALALAAAFALRFGERRRAGVLAGVLAAAAFFTKQTALVLFAPFAVCALLTPDRRWPAFFATFGALVAGGCALLHAASDGWFSYYVFELPGQHPLRWSKFESFWRVDLLAKLPVALAAAVSWFAANRPRAGGDRLRFAFYGCFAAGALGAAWGSRLHSGGYLNVLMPAHAVLAILFGLGLAGLAERAAARGAAARTALWALCLLQFAWLAADPRPWLPTAADRRAGEALVERLRGFEGDVLVLHHGYLPGLAGKATSAQFMAVRDVLRGADDGRRAALEDEIRGAIRARRYAAILLDEPWFADELAAAYTDGGAVFDGDVFWPVSGLRTRPERLWLADDGALRAGHPSEAAPP